MRQDIALGISFHWPFLLNFILLEPSFLVAPRAPGFSFHLVVEEKVLIAAELLPT